MLNFVVPLQSSNVSTDWLRVSRLCERTLRSICQQTSDQFRVFLVCNEAPAINFNHSALTVIEEAFPIPGVTTRSRMSDKSTKVRRGLVAAGLYGEAHVMIVDADDCVHCELAAHVATHPEAAGWRFEVGYMHNEGSRWVYRVHNFDRFCGTSAIVKLKDKDFPPDVSAKPEDYFILSHGHTTIAEFMARRGTPLHPLPFPGAVYIAGTGENVTGARLGRWEGFGKRPANVLNFRPLIPKLRTTFGLTEAFWAPER
jgi:hypothetical protein